MERKILELCRQQLFHLEELRDNYAAKAESLRGYERMTLNPVNSTNSSRQYYRTRDPDGRWKYLGSADNTEVKKIKEAHFLDKAMAVLDEDIKLLKNLLTNYSLSDYQEIIKLLPKTYKDAELLHNVTYNEAARKWKAAKEAEKASYGPWYPEGLISTVSDGTMVRTKSEAGICEVVIRNGLAYVYELPIRLWNGKLVHPDLTILSAIDFTTEVRIEHEGSMDDENYRRKHFWREENYWKSGYITNVNLFFTFDNPSGGVDMEGVQHIMDGWLKPKTPDHQTFLKF